MRGESPNCNLVKCFSTCSSTSYHTPDSDHPLILQFILRLKDNLEAVWSFLPFPYTVQKADTQTYLKSELWCWLCLIIHTWWLKKNEAGKLSRKCN